MAVTDEAHVQRRQTDARAKDHPHDIFRSIHWTSSEPGQTTKVSPDSNFMLADGEAGHSRPLKVVLSLR